MSGSSRHGWPRWLCLGLLVLMVAGCRPKARDEQDWSRLVRASVAEKVPVVVRAEAETWGTTDTYSWCRIRILHVMKNTSGEPLDETIDVRYFPFKLRIPVGESTFYIERVKRASMHPWTILGGSADTGTSHNRR